MPSPSPPPRRPAVLSARPCSHGAMAGGSGGWRRTTGITAARDENGPSYDRLRDAVGPRYSTGMEKSRGAAEQGRLRAAAARRPAPSSGSRGGPDSRAAQHVGGRWPDMQAGSGGWPAALAFEPASAAKGKRNARQGTRRGRLRRAAGHLTSGRSRWIFFISKGALEKKRLTHGSHMSRRVSILITLPHMQFILVCGDLDVS
jgi:hypothetical protein